MRLRSKRSHGKIVEGWCSWHHRCKLWYFLFYILSCLWWLWALRGSMFPRRLWGAGPTTAVMPAISSIACSGFGSRMSWFPQVILAIRFACTHHRCRIIQWTNTHTCVCVCSRVCVGPATSAMLGHFVFVVFTARLPLGTDHQPFCCQCFGGWHSWAAAYTMGSLGWPNPWTTKRNDTEMHFCTCT